MANEHATSSRPAPIGEVGNLQGLGEPLTVRYRCFTNDTTWFGRGYEPGDALIAGWSGDIAHTVDTDPLATAEKIFERHNRPDRPDGHMCPSMSVGDVIVLGEVALTVETVGFRFCHLDPDDVIDGTTWAEFHAAQTHTH